MGREKEVDEFSFCTSLAKLVNAQKQEIELAAVGKGEYKLKEKYKFLQISEDKWSRMQENQREKAVEKLHTVKIEASGPNIVKINNIVTIQDDPVMQQMLCGGIDWVPRESLSFTVNKAIALTTTPEAVTCQSNDTVLYYLYPILKSLIS